jgi:hypothetical protein
MGIGYSQMQCTAPLNIVKNLQTAQICKLKCSYQFTYTPTSLSIWNEGMFLFFGVDDVAIPPVIYNDTNYNVISAILVSPSLHTYNGSTTDAELIIWHMDSTFGKQLMVCVPIKANSETTADCATFFDLIMQEVTQTAPGTNQHTIYSNPTFSLQPFVPMKPYYSYTGSNLLLSTLLGGKCYKDDKGNSADTGADYLVYHIDNAIAMSPTALAALKKVIPKPLNVVSVDEKLNPGGLYYNPNGPVKLNSGEIYIDCQPTGSDGEVIVTSRKDTGGMLDNAMLKKIWNFTFMKILIGAMVMLIIWKMAMKLINGIASSSARMAGGAGTGGAGAGGAGAGGAGTGMAGKGLKK